MSRRNPSYLTPRGDLLALAPERWTRMLDVGCAEGAVGRALLESSPRGSVVGIELDPGMAAVAAESLEEVVVGDAIDGLQALIEREEEFDLVVCGDVLEHLADPWRALRLVRRLCPRGRVLVSLPNVAHVSTHWTLLRGRWPYRERGIHDASHLRYFARGNLADLFEQADFRIEALRTRHRILERPHPLNDRLEPILRLLPVVRTLTTYQFLCRLR